MIAQIIEKRDTAFGREEARASDISIGYFEIQNNLHTNEQKKQINLHIVLLNFCVLSKLRSKTLNYHKITAYQLSIKISSRNEVPMYSSLTLVVGNTVFVKKFQLYQILSVLVYYKV